MDTLRTIFGRQNSLSEQDSFETSMTRSAVEVEGHQNRHGQHPILFTDFPEEVLLLILTFCNALDIVAAGFTCRSLRVIMGSRALWMTVMENLDDDRAPNLPYYVDIDELETSQIKSLAIRAERSHRNWSPPKLMRASVAHINLPEDCDPSPDVETRVRLFNVNSLLPGNRFVIGTLSFTKTIACWDLWEEKLVFAHNVTPGHLVEQIYGLSAHICDRGESIVISVVKNVYSTRGNSAAVVFRYDLSRSGLETLSVNPVQSPDGGEAVLCSTGDTYTVFAIGKTLLVVNWRTRQSFRILHLASVSTHNLKICRNFALGLIRERRKECLLFVFSLELAERLALTKSEEGVEPSVLFTDVKAQIHPVPVPIGASTLFEAFYRNWSRETTLIIRIVVNSDWRLPAGDPYKASLRFYEFDLEHHQLPGSQEIVMELKLVDGSKVAKFEASHDSGDSRVGYKGTAISRSGHLIIQQLIEHNTGGTRLPLELRAIYTTASTSAISHGNHGRDYWLGDHWEVADNIVFIDGNWKIEPISGAMYQMEPESINRLILISLE